MAYSQGAVTVDNDVRRYKREHFVFSWDETGVDSSSEAEVENVPTKGTILRYKATLTSGSGSTINPSIGRETGFSSSTQDEVSPAPGAAAHIDKEGPIYFYAPDEKLYIKTSPNSGSDNAVSHELLIVEGWV